MRPATRVPRSMRSRPATTQRSTFSRVRSDVLAVRTTLALGLGLSLIVLACGQRSPLGTPRVVRCGAHSVFQTNAARIAVSPLDGDRDGAATELLMSAILRLDEEMTSDRTHRMFEVVRLKRGVASHDAARTCAENLGADVVVWGTLV